jgi:hydroxylaminobenzene mutase
MNRRQIQLGFVLILLGLLTGLGTPVFANARLGLSAHMAALMGGLVLIALGALNGLFALSTRKILVMHWTWAYAAYANWLACLIGAITGASRLTPIAGAGTSGSPIAESVVSFLLLTLSVAAIAGTAIAVVGLRKTAR